MKTKMVSFPKIGTWFCLFYSNNAQSAPTRKRRGFSKEGSPSQELEEEMFLITRGWTIRISNNWDSKYCSNIRIYYFFLPIF